MPPNSVRGDTIFPSPSRSQARSHSKSYVWRFRNSMSPELFPSVAIARQANIIFSYPHVYIH